MNLWIPRLLALCAGVLAPQLPAAAPAKMNVLFIMTDDLNCNLGAYGHPQVKTPHLDQLASEGLLFENAYCQFPLCGPSRASFMTGLYPEQNGVTELRRLFRNYVPDAVTLSQHFINHGYATARVGKIYHYDNPNGIGTNGHDDAASWQVRINPRGRDKDEEDKIFSLRPGAFGATLSWLASDGTDEEFTDGIVATESIQLLRQHAASGQPFFLATGFYRPHTPYVAPKKYFDLYDLDSIEVPRVPDGYLGSLPPSARKTLTVRKDQIGLPESTARQAIQAYYASISYIDAQIGRLLAELDALGLRQNTIVLFSSDHGYHMGEHDYYQKQTLFEDAAQVPLILSAPGMKTRGGTTRALVEMVDFYRTLSDLAGLPAPPPYVQGISLAPLLNDPAATVRADAFTQLQAGYSLRTQRYRYSRWMPRESEQAELYDRLNDPSEMVNLAGDPNYADIQRSLDQRLSERIAEAAAPAAGLAFAKPAPGDKGISQKELLESGH